ncbi:MAG: NTP transferase domain-containing protein [Chitinophagales bacterium]|nr:NTP transferase domain-containing protein [Chitinophagales bacterium]
MECIVLAGGFGTRLRSVVEDIPKCMAPVNEQPFLHYVFKYLADNYCDRVILSLGYKHEYITNWVNENEFPFTVDHVIEQEPLGTGGGIQLAMKEAQEENVFVLNGDTIFNVNLNLLQTFHNTHFAETTLALKEMHEFDRYGVVNVNDNGCINSFEEKQYRDKGLINGGAYLINKQALLDKQLPEKFSFEKDYLEAYVSEQKFYGYVSDGYFLDIGIPEDYYKAAEDFKTLF